ncbi:MAG: hypothetical protein JEZ06_12225 [Anaerolineaceae bacterium]|nr:hypothetical protein [Anaerolineaceae bacterium]
MNRKKGISLKEILKIWWPLAASWLLMSFEGPLISAVMARLQFPEISLASYGGVVFPLALIIEAPIIMLLPATTALCKDYRSYKKIRKFMMLLSAALTLLHILIAFTPVYYWVVEGLLGAPQEIVEPSRIGLMLMLPWTWAIAYRRFNQGVMIRYGHSNVVMETTISRLITLVLILAAGFLISGFSGIVVGTLAQAVAVTVEGIYSGIRVRTMVQNEVKTAPEAEELTWRHFFDFYIPLVLTSLLNFLGQPIGSAAISRMPNPVESLAVWSVLSSFLFLLRSVGIAYNEVVVAQLDEKWSSYNLRKFTVLLVSTLSIIAFVSAATPLSLVWFKNVTALSIDLARMARQALWLAIPLPAMSVLQSWFQGALLYGRKTRGVSESVVIFLATFVLVMFMGVAVGTIKGVYVSAAAYTIATLIQNGWMWYRSRPIMQSIKRRDEIPSAGI